MVKEAPRYAGFAFVTAFTIYLLSIGKIVLNLTHIREIGMKKIIVFAVLMAASFTAQAGGKPLYVEKSHTGETMDAFAVRISTRANRITKVMSAEVCGEIQEVNGSYEISIYSSGDMTQCTFSRPETGRTGIMFHTHPANQSRGFAHDDFANAGYMSHPITGVIFHNGDGVEVKVL